MFRNVLLAAAMTVMVAAPASAQLDPAPYGGGSCREMSQNHDPKSLWVGRFVGLRDRGAPVGAYHDVACFTEQQKCMSWVNRESGQGVTRIIEMTCHHGL